LYLASSSGIEIDESCQFTSDELRIPAKKDRLGIQAPQVCPMV
jgi:hypothetical protein